MDTSENFYHNYPESKNRRLLVYIASTLILILTILRSWDVSFFKGETLPQESSESISPKKPVNENILPPLEEKALMQEAKIAVGTYFMLQEGSRFSSQEIDESLKEQLLTNFQTNIKKQIIRDKKYVKDLSLKSLRARAILGKHLKEDITVYTKELEARSENALNNKILELLRLEDEASISLSKKEKKEILKELSWLGDLLLFKAEKDPEIKKTFVKKFEKQTIPKLIGIFGAVTLLSTAFFSFIACLIYQFKSGFKSNLSPPSVPSTHLLETFTLYLILMLSGGYILEKLILNNIVPRSLYAQVAVIVTSLLAALLPSFYKISLKDNFKEIGLKIDSLKDFCLDVIRTPFLYFAAIIPIGISLIFYSQALIYFGIDMSQGAHPIVPILASSKGSKIFIIFFLAVICAPIIEEIMFRGALYTWLRARMNIAFSVIISAFIFAIVHPQGPVGIFPLTMIGAFLALLREWRGNLIAPMIAHACVNSITLILVLLFLS